MAALCEDLTPRVPPGRLRGIADRLAGPLELTVAGRVCAGKSTLVNALIGRRVAETSATTRYPAEYRHGDLTIIDTPGLGAPGRPDPTLAGTAEAMLYVLDAAVRVDDAATLADVAAAQHPGPGATIAVLSKADTLTAPADRAAQAAAALGTRVTGVLPVVGLYAESAETGRFDTADVTALRTVAGLPGTDLLLSSVDEFVEAAVPVPVADRRRLLECLGLHGIRTLLPVAHEPVAALRRRLVELSGFPELRRRIDAVLLDRLDAVKAVAALGVITDRCRGIPAARDGMQALLARPEAHQLRVLDVAHRVATGAVELAPELAAEVVSLAGPGVRDADHALERARWWRSYAGFGATPDQARVAEVVHRAYFLAYQELSR